MPLTTNELSELSRAIREHNHANPFTSEPFRFDQIRVLSDVLFGVETTLAKQEWETACADY